jgi:hypothetical protein
VSVASLPSGTAGEAPGVTVTPSKVHPRDFATTHRSTAASGRLDCAGCHAKQECTSCHEGSSARRYHAPDFSSAHASQAYGGEQSCSSCHRTETFCRSCHAKTGVSGTSTLKGTAHTGQPIWLFQHAQAARQGLSGCTTCHQQRDCLRCHSSLGLKVSPHGPDFDASRAAAKNRQVCYTCHISDPLRP